MADLRLKVKGFSLVELLTVVLIIGILAAIAIPSYTKHIRKSRLSEAITNLTTIDTYQETYFSEEDKYTCLAANPATVPVKAEREHFDVDIASWRDIGTPIADNTALNFQYQAWAGQFDGQATPLISTGVTCFSNTNDWSQKMTAGAEYCPAGTAKDVSAETLGIPRASFSNFFFITAVADQDGDGICSLLVKVIDRPDIYKVDEIE